MRNLSGLAYYRMAMFHHGRTSFAKAEENYYKAIAEFSLSNNLDMIGGTYLNLGAMYSAIPDYAKCLEVNQQAIAIYEKMNNEEDLASCYTNLASIYQDLGNESQSLVYLKMALKVFLKEGQNARGVAVVNEYIGLAYLNADAAELGKMGTSVSDRLTLAQEYFQKSLKSAEVLNDEAIIASSTKLLGDVYAEMGNRELALSAYKKAIQLSEPLDDKVNYTSTLLALGSYYQKGNDFENAILFLSNCFQIASNNNLLEDKKNAALGLSDIFERLKNYDKSLSYYKAYVETKGQIFNVDKEREITKRQMQIDFGIKEKDYLFKQRITSVELQKQVLLAKQQQQQLFLRKQQLALSDKEKSLQRLTFLKKQLDLEIDKETQSSNFERAKLQAKYETSLRDKQITKQEQQIKFDWRVRFFLIIAVGLMLLIAILVFFSQRRVMRLNKVINQQKRELEQLSKVKDRIFSVVSHDMRTPVNSLISFIQLLEGGNIDQDKLTRYAATLKNNLTYTSSMMENLLNWAASQMQGFNPYLERLEISKVIEEVILSVQHHADLKDIVIHNNVSVDKVCKADENMITLVMRNLISNAVKFTAHGGNITISVQDFLDDVAIIVADDGLGLKPDQLNHFNSSGYLGVGMSTPGTDKEKGTGLGLMLCRTFVALMDGTISASNNTPQGTTFKILLPK
ncbi:tetratricopeptide repeat-containing sensor histidine kinase [Pedobacter sandarakinus]|uniref:tetratricopeptide repeat-containing sensor histidine kinase n=1 Tax=Pedobacter sandarakinus TaxID=353156 RepID=UPI002246CA2D|nr:tetratricopeptide repeat-containing sensor histidine kinase [Pedobacter sandarakinus]MCX2574178.1 tetratricopeptide repeat-containing sensor histidine kinase [Pedobacter sandarakinus]